MPNKPQTCFYNEKRQKETDKCKEHKTHKLLAANTYLADGVSGGVVVAWMLVLNPFAAFNLGGVTTLIKLGY